LARFLRKKVIMSNIGVGPLLSPGGERLARWILNQVDFVSVRDDKSLRTCQNLGIRLEKVCRVPNAVFANPPEVFLSDAAAFAPSESFSAWLPLLIW
jgi:polysaccharide pyruvyl transferase WcaK-like protein